jgi:peptidoglycan/LPS O-acetylase OafA/YrhL
MGILRFILAVSVVLAHCGPIFGFSLIGGRIAVQVFFIFSGFYMSLILNEKYRGENSYFLFLTNRFLRLFPVYWFTLICTIFFYFAVLVLSKNAHNNPLDKLLSIKDSFNLSFPLWFSNIFLVFQDWSLFLKFSDTNTAFIFTENFNLTKIQLNSFLLIPQAWTLGLEITYYVIAPFLVRKSLRFQFVIITLSLILRALLYYKFKLVDDPWNYRFFFTEIFFFQLGSVVYLLIKRGIINVKLSLMFSILLLPYTIFFQYLNSILRINFLHFSLVEVGYFISILLSIPFLFKFSNNYKFDNHIGELSYPIYITHTLIAMICYASHRDWLTYSISILFITILFSIFLNRFISDPIQKFRMKRIFILKQ